MNMNINSNNINSSSALNIGGSELVEEVKS